MIYSSTVFAGDTANAGGTGSLRQAPEFHTYIRLLLASHPEIKALKAEAEAKGHMPSQEYSLPNPQVSFGVMDLPIDSFDFTREDMTLKKIGVSQAFPGVGKRDLRRKVAEDEAEMATEMVGEKRLELIEQVRLWYYELQSLLRVREIVRKNKETLKGIIDVALTRYSVGDGTQQDVLAAQLEYSKMNEYFIGIDRQVASISRVLNVWAVLPDDTVWDSPKIARLPEVTGTDDELVLRAMGNRPVFKALATAVKKADDSLQLSRRELSPDVVVSVSYGQRDNTPMRRSDLVSAEIMFDLPLYRSAKQDQMVVQSELLADRSRLEIDAEKIRLRRDIAELMEGQIKNQKLLELYDTSLLPQAHQAVDAALSAYRVNKVDFRWLVMNQSSLFDHQIQRSRIEYDLLAARAKIKRLLGEEDEVSDGN